MAQIKLSLSDLGAASQLDRCMCCGEKASVRCDKSFVVWWWALGQSRWCYITAVGVAILAMNYSLDGLWKWSALAALFCSVAFIVRLMARRSWN